MTIILMMAAAAGAAAPPQNPPAGSPLIAAVQACQNIRDDAARLQCYDRSVSALAAANARGDVKIVDRQQMREARRSLFGFGGVRIPFFSGSKDVEQEPKQLVSKVASFRSIGNGYVRVSIADPDSTWESTEPTDVYDVKAGEKVTIEHGAIGSYWLEIGSNRAFHARRVR